MILHGTIYSSLQPQAVEITPTAVYVASNIAPYTKTIEGHSQSGYSYECVEYTKDEYIVKLSQDLIDTQQALCDIYEMIEGGE